MAEADPTRVRAVAVAMALEAAGVNTAAIVADKQRSNDVLPALGRRFARARGLPEPVPVPPLEPAAITAVLDHWRGRPGGLRRWLTERGLPAQTYALLRDRMRGLDSPGPSTGAVC